MNCRKQLGVAACGEGYKPPTKPLDVSRLIENVHLRSYVRNLFHFCKMIPGTMNCTIDSYKEVASKVIKFLVPKAEEKVVVSNVGSDTILHLKTGLSFDVFFKAIISYCSLATGSSNIQDLIDSVFKVLVHFNPDLVDPGASTSLTRKPEKLPLSSWAALISAASDIRPCYVMLGVNTQRSKIFEKILSDATGALLLDIPTLIQWPLRPESVENARQKLLKGGYLTYNDSRELILECAKTPAANYRGWIIPTSFHKDNFDFSTLFNSYSEFEQRCFLVDFEASLESLLEIANTRQFDPQDEKIISSLNPSSLLFVQRLKKREFVGREIEEAVEEEEEEKNEDEEEEDQDEKLMLYKAPKYSSKEETADETHHLEEEDEAKDRIFILPEESEKQITDRYNQHMKERESFQFQNKTKIILIDATQSLREMSNIICDKTSVLIPAVYPTPLIVNEEEEPEEPRYSPLGENCVVSLVDEKRFVKGDPKFTLKYYSFHFLFETEEKMRRFADYPVRYLQEVYHTYFRRVLIVGPKLAGKKTLAAKLAEFFDSEVVEFDRLIEEGSIRVPKKVEEPEEEDGEATDENATETTAEETTETATDSQQIETSEPQNPSEENNNPNSSENADEENRETEPEQSVADTTEEASQETLQESEQVQGATEEEQSNESQRKTGDEEEEKKEEVPKEPEFPPVFEKGYVSIVPSLNDLEKLKIFQEVEYLAPEMIIIVRITTEDNHEIIRKRIESSFVQQNVDPSQAETFLKSVIKEIDKWNEKFNESQDTLGSLGFPSNIVDGILTLDEVFWQAVYSVDPLLPKCTDPQEDEPKFGYLGPYCPVTLKDKRLLQSGVENTAYFMGANFGFADDRALERFRAAPLCFTSALPIVPPPRILIVGSRGTSKSSIAASIGKAHNAPVFEMPMNPKFVPVNEEEEEPDPEEVAKKILEPFFEKVLKETDDQTKGWIIEGTPSHPSAGQLLLDSGLKPDFVIMLEHDEKWALMRNRARVQDEEEIMNRESEDSGIANDVANTVAEVTAKAEPVVINTSRRFTSIMDMIGRVLQRELTLRKSLFLSQSAGPLEEPMELLRKHRLFVSQFGRYCPVCFQQTGQLHMTDMNIACDFLGRIFFFETEKHRQMFIDDPLRFVLQLRPPVFPFVPRVSVLGCPELAQRLADTLSAELIKPRDVITRVARHQTTFGDKIRTILSTGGSINAEMFKQALSIVLAKHDCQVRGYVLDNYPSKLDELLEMRSKGIMPADIVFVKGDEELVNHSTEKFHNMIDASKEPTVWMQLIKSNDKLQYNMKQRWEALLAMDEKRSYCISSLDVSPEEVASKLSDFGHYCPVSFVASEVCVESRPNDWENIVQHEGKFYHMHDVISRSAFLTSPLPFVNSWPGKAVSFARVENDQREAEVEGYDMIHLSRGQFIQGNKEFSAVYNDKKYLFESLDHLNLFCSVPEQFANVKLPPHRPVAAPPDMTSTGSLPTVPFLEQTVGDVVSECIAELTKRRPKIPGKSFEISLNEYVSAYVKAHSPNVGPLLHEKFVGKMSEMDEVVALAATLKASLETPVELRDETEHERLCSLWKRLHSPR